MSILEGYNSYGQTTINQVNNLDKMGITRTSYPKLIEDFDLWIWDFDKTILKIHAYHDKITATEVQRKTWKQFERDFADSFHFNDLLTTLQMNDKKFAIASFGTYNVIKAYLERLTTNVYSFSPKNIVTPLCGNQRYGDKLPSPPADKNQIIISLAKYNDVPLNRVIFFDDSKSNINKANNIGVKGVWCPNHFTRDLLHRTENIYIKELTKQTEVNLKSINQLDNQLKFRKDFNKLINQTPLGVEWSVPEEKSNENVIEGFTTSKKKEIQPTPTASEMNTLNKKPSIWWERVQLLTEILALVIIIVYMWMNYY